MERILRAGMALAVAALVCGPAEALAQAQTTTPDPALSKLQTTLAANPNSVKALQAVGYRLYQLKRFAEARPVLDQARNLDPNNGPAALYSGLCSEELKDWTAAKAAYTKYLQVGRTKDAKKEIQARLLVVSREEMKLLAKQAATNEQALRGVTVPDKTVAVMPFRCVCTDTSYMPLERGMAELVVTDLAKSSALKVLERDRMQAIVDEIKLSSSSQVDAATATRTGKLIAAGRVLNGTINIPTGASVDILGSLVNTNSAQIDASPEQRNGTLNALFDAEKSFVGKTFDALGVKLTPAEAKEFAKRPTGNLQAFLAYSRGLQAEDGGRYDEAQRYFENARALDPGFGAALQRAQTSAAARASSQTSAAKVDAAVKSSSEGAAVTAAAQGSTANASVSTTLNTVIGDVNPTTTTTVQNNSTASGGSTGGTGGTGGSSGGAPTTNQNTVSQATGTDQPAQRTGQVTIVIKKP